MRAKPEQNAEEAVVNSEIMTTAFKTIARMVLSPLSDVV
jgi:hypothetical protein